MIVAAEGATFNYHTLRVALCQVTASLPRGVTGRSRKDGGIPAEPTAADGIYRGRIGIEDASAAYLESGSSTLGTQMSPED